MKLFRLIRTGALGARENMDLDARIYRGFLQDGIGTLRIYSWEKPSFTFGFSQNPQELLDLDLCAKDGVQAAKRITGGGLLFHDREITYSFACSKSDIGEDSAVFVDYRNICRFLLEFYRSLGLSPAFARDSAGFSAKSGAHKLCSAAYEKYDLVLGGKKIGGNAQKRSRQAIFQHGSIPLSIDWALAKKYVRSWPDGLETGVTCLEKELNAALAKKTLEEKLIRAFAGAFNLEFSEQNETCLAG